MKQQPKVEPIILQAPTQAADQAVDQAADLPFNKKAVNRFRKPWMSNVLSISEEESQGKSESEHSDQLRSQPLPNIDKLLLEGKLEEEEVKNTQISGFIDTQGMLISQADEE